MVDIQEVSWLTSNQQLHSDSYYIKININEFIIIAIIYRPPINSPYATNDLFNILSIEY